jgi:hypothetical protein
MWPYRGLAAEAVHLATLACPISLDLAADVLNALGKVAKKHGLVDPVILTDGSGRLIARRPS